MTYKDWIILKERES